MPHKLEKRLSELERKLPAPSGPNHVIWVVIDPATKKACQWLRQKPGCDPIEITEEEAKAV